MPDEALHQVFGILEDQLIVAYGLLADIETVYFQTPTCYPEREVDGREHIAKAAEVMTLYIQLLDRIAERRPDLANAHATTWPETDRYFFRKLKLYAFAKGEVFDAEHVAKAVLAVEQRPRMLEVAFLRTRFIGHGRKRFHNKVQRKVHVGRRDRRLPRWRHGDRRLG